ncbi:hypothetical protein BDW71DRAFT_163273 [Aspergillus fruticulosus]
MQMYEDLLYRQLWHRGKSDRPDFDCPGWGAGGAGRTGEGASIDRVNHIRQSIQSAKFKRIMLLNGLSLTVWVETPHTADPSRKWVCPRPESFLPGQSSLLLDSNALACTPINTRPTTANAARRHCYYLRRPQLNNKLEFKGFYCGLGPGTLDTKRAV